MDKFKIAIVVGSNRVDSINRKLAQALVPLFGDRFAVSFAQIDDLPMYNQDQEQPPPASVERFKADIEGADGILFVTPEHSRSIPAVLKNAIDWGARPWGRTSWPGKVAAVTGTSPGAIGTAIAQQHLRQILGTQGVLLTGGEAYITFKPGLLDDKGTLKDESSRTFLAGFVTQFAQLVEQLAAGKRAAKT